MTLHSCVVRLEALLNRFPWLVPAVSFAAGWIGFIMVQRSADLARVVGILALAGWPWLLMEPLVRRRLERRKAGIGNFVVNFVSQSLQQELLFFSLPLLIGSTQNDVGQIAFTALVAFAALISTLDPVYERYIAARAATRLVFHAYCSWIAALVVLPMVLRLPLERALPLSLVAVGACLLLTLPLSLISLHTWRQRTIWVACLLIAPTLAWGLRDHVPAAGFAVTEARITKTVEDLTPGPRVRELADTELSEGVVAFVAVRAPRGVSQSVIFEWRHGDYSDRIEEEIHGGVEYGFRTYSRKQVFPANSKGRWRVDILTPEGQLLKRLRFSVK